MATINNSCISIIAARAGSKRIPGKNKKILLGKPLYVHTLEAAIESDVFDDIIFTTDDEEILSELKNYPRIIINPRPFELAGNNIVIWDVGKYILNKYNDIAFKADTICFLTPCSPFRGAKHICEAYQLYIEKRAAALQSITEFPAPIELYLEKNDMLVKRTWRGPHRAADYQKKYYPNGAIMMVDKQYFIENKDFYPENTVGYEMDWPHCMDIDEEQELETARIIAEKYLA